jgi:hypothetical protein
MGSPCLGGMFPFPWVGVILAGSHFASSPEDHRMPQGEPC